MKIPIDNKEMTKKYLKDRGGICGQSCLAVITENSIKKVLDDWKEMGIEFKGYSGWKQLREYLEKRGFFVKQKRWNKIEILNKDSFYLVRVQWLGNGKKIEKPFYGWSHWTEASSYTHFMVIHKDRVFCNETGIFDYELLSKYLDDGSGLITSAFEISKEELANV